MPIYEYQCNQCKENLELLVHSDDDAKCSQCGSKDLSKKLSLFSVSSGRSIPDCSSRCEGGLEQGTCGSGMCSKV